MVQGAPAMWLLCSGALRSAACWRRCRSQKSAATGCWEPTAGTNHSAYTQLTLHSAQVNASQLSPSLASASCMCCRDERYRCPGISRFRSLQWYTRGAVMSNLQKRHYLHGHVRRHHSHLLLLSRRRILLLLLLLLLAIAASRHPLPGCRRSPLQQPHALLVSKAPQQFVCRSYTAS